MVRIAPRISRSTSGSMRALYAWRGVCARARSARLRAPPHQRAVVGRHRVVCGEAQAARLRLGIERLEITHAALGVALPEVVVESRVAVARVPSPETERPVDAQCPGRHEHRADATEELA